MEPLSVFLHYHKAFEIPHGNIPLKFKKDFELASPIMDSFPHEFQNGVQVENLSSQCSQCGYAMENRQYRGIVDKEATYLTVRGFAWCPDCERFERVHLRINDQWGIQIQVAPRKWISKNIVSEAQKEKSNHTILQKIINFLNK